MADERKKRELNMVIAEIRASMVSSGLDARSAEDILNDYRKDNDEDIPFRRFGRGPDGTGPPYSDLRSFLIDAVGCTQLSNGLLRCDAGKASHIKALVAGQKTKPKVQASSAPRLGSYRPRPPSPARLPPVPKPSTSASSLGLNNLSPPAKSIRSIRSREELESLCSKMFTSPFRHELRVKLKHCTFGCTPEDYAEYFNQSNFERFGFRKDLDLKGLTLLEFCNGLTDVFRVETENGVVRLYPALTKSLSLNKLGNPSPPIRNSGLSAAPSQAFHSTSAASVRRFPTIDEMSVIFKRANEFYAGQEVGMTEYLSKVTELGSDSSDSSGDVTAWLMTQNFNIGKLTSLLKDKLGFSIDAVPGKEAIFIRDTPRPAVVQANEVKPNGLSCLKHVPYSIAFKMERLPCGNGGIDMEVNGFEAHAPNFYFTPVELVQKRLELMKRLLQHEHAEMPRAQLERGAACIVEGEDGSGSSRAAVLSVDDKFAEVYLVDFGETDSVAVDKLYRISEVYLQESVYAYPATMANVRPADGGDTFNMKTLQEIKFELDTHCVKGTLLRYREDTRRYDVDLGDTAKSLEKDGLLTYNIPKPSPVMTNGFHSMPSRSNGVPNSTAASTNGTHTSAATTNGHAIRGSSSKLKFDNRVLPTCETIVVVGRDSTAYVLSSDVSRVLGLSENTFLSALEKYCIAATDTWEPTPEVIDHLRVEHGSAPPAGDVLIPVRAVPPLMRAHLYIEKKTLDNEKNVLRAFEKMAI